MMRLSLYRTIGCNLQDRATVERFAWLRSKTVCGGIVAGLLGIRTDVRQRAVSSTSRRNVSYTVVVVVVVSVVRQFAGGRSETEVIGAGDRRRVSTVQ